MVQHVELVARVGVHEALVFGQAQLQRQFFESRHGVLALLGAADADALETEQRLGDGPATIHFAHDVFLGHAHVTQEGLAEFLVAGKVTDRPQLDSRRAGFGQQEADAFLLLGLLVGAHQHEDVRGVLGQRGPGLLAVDDEMIAVQHRLGAQAGEVGAGVRLGVALAPDMLAGENLRQVVGLLFLGAVLDQQRPDHDDAHVRGAADAVQLKLLHEDDQL